MRLYTVSEISDMFHVCAETARRWMARGDFGLLVNTGRVKLVSQSGLDHYFETHTCASDRRPAPSVRSRSKKIVVAGKL